MNLPQLAAILRENGDKVLNAMSKLSLSTTLLKDLNDSFGLIIDEREALNSTFQVIGTSSSKIELLRDLQFLHDFIQRTVSLKLSPSSQNYDPSDFIDIRKFKNLKLLELRKISINQIIGLQSVRLQLQYIVCVRCINNLKELFVDCGADRSERFVWSELKEAVLSYNNLVTIDNSLEYVPWLQSLDLSHNCIINAQALDCLPNLKHLNLSYNQLEAVPLFNKEVSRKLQVLVLKNNYIEDLTGLLLLDNLITLDLSCNCLVDHQSLNTLPQLAALQWLSLDGNPLCFHPNHRTYTARLLHTNTVSVKFVLDGVLLSKLERLQVGTVYTTVSRTPGTPRNGNRTERQHLSSISSSASVNTHTSEVTTIPSLEYLSRSQTSRKGKVRNAIIAERDDTGEIINVDLISSVHSVDSIEASMEHLETKKQIDILRNKYGESWLKSIGGSLVQDVLGMPKTEIPNISSSPYEIEFKLHASEELEKTNSCSSPINGDHIKDLDKCDVISDLSTNNTFMTASESSLFEDKDATLELESNAAVSDEEQSEDGGEEHLYLAQIKTGETDSQEVFLMITDKYIKERDTSNGHVKCKWLLEVLLSCERIFNEPPTVCVEFDTVRRNMKHREYVLEDEEARKFVRELNDIISVRSLTELNQTLFHCMKCSCRFTFDTMNLKKGVRKIVPICPSCKSTLVYEVDESTPTNRVAQDESFTKEERAESPSECSIASEIESGPLSHIYVTAEVHRVSTSFPTDCSAASVQESNSSQISVDENLPAGNMIKKYESDIEVISNPSQSSIEVLDDHIRPSRKRSSEERGLLAVPTLVTIPDIITTVANNPMMGLTESSSSSSFTESVCTAYDFHTHTSRPASGLEVRTIQEEEDIKSTELLPTEKNKTGLITSIFEGLFSGATIGTKSLSKSSSNTSDIKFSFDEDFSNVDHRVKLHLYQHMFEDEHEDFIWLLRCSLLSPGASDIIPACLVLSTQKVYILQIKNHSLDDDIIEWLVKKDSYTIDRLRTVFALPWKQGIGIEIKTIGMNTVNHLCILQDMQRTSNFMAFLATNPPPVSCDLVSVTPDRPMMNLQHLLLSSHMTDASKTTNICLLSIFSKCVISNTSTKEQTMGVLIVTAGDLILIEDLVWLNPDSEMAPTIWTHQPISNLIELEFEDKIIEFHFLDEVANHEEVWSIEWATEDSMGVVISAVRLPWEQIFSVPLQVNHKVHSI